MIRGIKMKVYPVSSVNNDHLFDPELVKFQFCKKIDHRLSVMHNQRRHQQRSGNLSSVKRSTRKNKAFFPKVFPVQKASIFNRQNVTTAELLSYVNSAMELQQNTCEAAVDTNRAYDFQVLVTFLEAFVSFLFNFYYMIAVIATPEAFKLPQSESIMYLLQRLIEPCICISIPVVGFALVQYQFQKTQRIVNRIIIHSIDNDIRVRFLAFSQQIQSNIPRFTIFGFFTLDGSVIFSMISATTTYLIILVQNVGSPSPAIPTPLTYTNDKI